MKPWITISVTGLFWLLTAGCQQPFGEEYVVEQELQPYVESFHQEASARGRIILEENLIMIIKDDLGYRGLSLWRSGQRLIYIDREYYNYHKQEHDVIEFVVFHEMGHAFLGREHTDNYNSIMNIKRVDYSLSTRKELLDELFNPLH